MPRRRSASRPFTRQHLPMTTTASDPRLYVILRADLPPGLMLAQAAHVARKFTRRFADLPVEEDENLIVLSEKDEPALEDLLLFLRWEAPLARFEEFREPDLGGALTAVAIHGGENPELARWLRKLLSKLPLALRELERAA